MNERRLSAIGTGITAIAISAAILVIVQGVPARAETAPPPTADVAAQGAEKIAAQAFFSSPETAAAVLFDAVKSGDSKRMDKVLGPASSQLIYTGDAVADQQMRDRFVDAYEESFKLEQVSEGMAMLLVGANESPFPFPILKSVQGWQFDATAGAEEIINRRIGENELFAMKFCLAYGDAQREYAELDRDGDGLIEYAQHFRSSAGKRNGLYWDVKEGEPESPLGPIAAQALIEGYAPQDAKPIPLHGYYFRILTAQGPLVDGGAYDYLVNGNMIGGYGLVAYPARWGASGVMTFTCNHDGQVYEKNLGEATADIASKMTLFNPDVSWRKAE